MDDRDTEGIQAYGTIVKSPVATGAELVAYGPFTDSNYFRQPYTSKLNFDTDAFSISVWIKPTANYVIRKCKKLTAVICRSIRGSES